MALIEWKIDDSVAVLTMNSGENRFNLEFVDAFLAALDEIESKTQAKALVAKSADPKIWCNGLDLAWLNGLKEKNDNDTFMRFYYHQNLLHRRVITYPMVTVAAVNGHAFAGGAIFSCAFDFRFMRSDRGYFCLPEVDLGIPIPIEMISLAQSKLPSQLVVEMQLTGKRYTAAELEKQGGFLKSCKTNDDTIAEAVTFAGSLNKERKIVTELKKTLYYGVIVLMDKVIPPELISK